MNIKRMILGMILLVSVSIFAQTKSEVDLIQAAFGIEKQQIVSNYVSITKAQNESFWKIYDEYEAKRKELGKARIELLNQYSEQWDNLTNEQAEEWMKKVMDLSLKQDKLINTYYSKVKKITDARVATQFYQVEAFILTTIRYEILSAMPFVKGKK